MAMSTIVKRDPKAMAALNITMGLIGKNSDEEALIEKQASAKAIFGEVCRHHFAVLQYTPEEAEAFVINCLKVSGKGKRVKGAATHSYVDQCRALQEIWASAGKVVIE